jgi:hypothetical protein
MIVAAVAAAELLRYLGYLVLVRRVLELRAAQLLRAHVPAVFVGAGVALAVAGVRWALDGGSAVAALAAEIVAGALALAVCIRLCPTPWIRTELRYRLVSARLLGPLDGRGWRVTSLVVGRPEQATTEAQR